MIIQITLSPITLILIVVLIEMRCEARNIGENSVTQIGKTIRNDYHDRISSCKCSDSYCECCSIVGPSKMCNKIKLVNLGVEQDPALELSVLIGKSKIFSQHVTIKDMERMCHPYGDYNLCIEVDNTKSTDENVQVCANVLAKQKADDNVGESTMVKSQIFCLPFETRQLNKHLLQLLRFVSQ